MIKQYYRAYISFFMSLFPTPTKERRKKYDEDKKKSDKLPLFLAHIFLVALVAVVVLFLVNLLGLKYDTNASMGTFGDFFGGVLNPILTFLTLFGLIATIVIQRQELGLARIEYEKTADALSTQAIETTFFNMIDLHHKIVDELSLDLNELVLPDNKSKKVSDIFKNMIYQFNVMGLKIEPDVKQFSGRKIFHALSVFLKLSETKDMTIKDVYIQVQNQHNYILGHYFRNLYQIMKVIHKNESISDDDKTKYMGLLRAQLSTFELAILFINCLDGVCDDGEFRFLLYNYRMLEHLPMEYLGYSNSYKVARLLEFDEDTVQTYIDVEDPKPEYTRAVRRTFLSSEKGAFGDNKNVYFKQTEASEITKDLLEAHKSS